MARKCSKYAHACAHIVLDGKLLGKTSVYCLRTKVISKLVLFIKLTGDQLTGDSILKFAEFWVFRTYIEFPNCECLCLLNKSSLTRDGPDVRL